MPFRIKPSRLARRKKLIDDGVEAASRWDKAVRDHYLAKGRQDILHDEAITDEFRHDMLKARKARILMGAQAAQRRMG